MRIIQRVGAICAIAGGIAGSVVAFGGPAQAATCPANRLCLFTGNNYNGTRAVFKWGSPNLQNQGIGRLGSYINNDNIAFCLYSYKNYKGGSYRVKPHSRAKTYGAAYGSVKPC